MEINTVRKDGQVRIILQGNMDEKNAMRLRDHFRALDMADIKEVELDSLFRITGKEFRA